MVLKIHIHSFVDLITNSSTEIYIRVNDNAIETLKSIINSLLGLGNSNKTADDLFEFEIDVPDKYDYWDDDEQDYWVDYDNCPLCIVVKNKTKESTQSAKLLSKLHTLFYGEEVYT